MDQTVLDRSGDWYLLPQRPFETPVWAQLLPRPGSRVEAGTIYTLSKAVRDSTGAELAPGNFVVIDLHPGVLEIRAEEPSDMPCVEEGEGAAPPDRPRQTHRVNADEFCDGDLHLQILPAYPKGC